MYRSTAAAIDKVLSCKALATELQSSRHRPLASEIHLSATAAPATLCCNLRQGRDVEPDLATIATDHHIALPRAMLHEGLASGLESERRNHVVLIRRLADDIRIGWRAVACCKQSARVRTNSERSSSTSASIPSAAAASAARK